MTNQGLALGAVTVSVALMIGWHYWAQKWTADQRRQNISEHWRSRLAQFFYFVGIPYLALVFGILTPQQLGLKGLEYFNLINWSGETVGPQIQQAVTLMLLEWLLDFNMILLAGSMALLLFIVVWLNLVKQDVIYSVTRQPMLSAVYWAAHWAFYRAVFWAVTGNLYLGIILGSGLVLLEWVLIEVLQNQRLAQNQKLLMNAIILVLTSAIFFYSQNLWLLLPIHLGMVAIVNSKWTMGYQWKTQ